MHVEPRWIEEVAGRRAGTVGHPEPVARQLRSRSAHEGSRGVATWRWRPHRHLGPVLGLGSRRDRDQRDADAQHGVGDDPTPLYCVPLEAHSVGTSDWRHRATAPFARGRPRHLPVGFFDSRPTARSPRPSICLSVYLGEAGQPGCRDAGRGPFRYRVEMPVAETRGLSTTPVLRVLRGPLAEASSESRTKPGGSGERYAILQTIYEVASPDAKHALTRPKGQWTHKAAGHPFRHAGRSRVRT